MSTDNKAKAMIETREHSMNLKGELTNVQSLDSDGVVIDVSPGWLMMTGYEREDVIGHSFREVLVEESLGKVKSEFPHLKDYGFVNNVPLKIRRKDGVIIEAVLNGTSKYDKDGNFERTFCELRTLDYYMNSIEAVSGILATEKFLRMVMNLKTNIAALYQYIMNENYTIQKLYSDLLTVLAEPSEVEQVMIGTDSQNEEDGMVKARVYYIQNHKTFPDKNLLLVNGEGYYGSVSSEFKDISVVIMSVDCSDESENTLMFIRFNNSNLPYKEWYDAWGAIRLQIESLLVLVKALKEIQEVDESLKKLI